MTAIEFGPRGVGPCRAGRRSTSVGNDGGLSYGVDDLLCALLPVPDKSVADRVRKDQESDDDCRRGSSFPAAWQDLACDVDEVRKVHVSNAARAHRQWTLPRVG
jgi:hypothetical protein